MAVEVDIESRNNGIFIPKNIQPGYFTHFALDNLDFQEHSLDGSTTHGTTHIMFQYTDDVSSSVSLPLIHHRTKIKGVSRQLKFSENLLTSKDRARSRCLKNIDLKETMSEERNYDIPLIWNLVNLDEDASEFHSNVSWNTFYENLLKTNNAFKTVIGYGPFVPASPTRVEIVEKSIEYFVDASRKLKQDYVVITADEAIYEIVHGLKEKFPERYSSLVPRMGGFHICLNFLGAIGRIMANSGIEDILVEAKVLLRGTANKVISGGKDYYKMIRAHFLIHSAVFELYWESFTEWLEQENILDEDVEALLTEVEILRGYIKEEDFDSAALSYANASNFISCIDTQRSKFESTFQEYPTARFWIQYIKMVCILQWYIIAERCGDWKQHLTSTEKMLPFMVAAGHHKYASYIPHYLISMKNLEKTAPKVWEEFKNGNFVVKVKTGTFNGVWTDLALEQTYNKDAKNHLFRGITMQENTVQKYLNSLPLMSIISDQIENMATEDQVRAEVPRKSQEHVSDFDKNYIKQQEIKSIIKSRINPFCYRSNDLVNIFSGYKSPSSDVFKAEEIGLNALRLASEEKLDKVQPVKLNFFSDKLKGKSVLKSSKLYEDEAKVLRHLHFTRELDDETKIRIFSHEWTEYPASLFEPLPETGNIVMRKGAKSELYNALKKELSSEQNQVDIELQTLPVENLETAFIVDMMALVQKYQNFNCSTFTELFEKYITILNTLKPENCNFVICVGDRYDNEQSLKCSERTRRAKGIAENVYAIQDGISIPDWKTFISTSTNKSNLLHYFATKLCNEHPCMSDNLRIVLAGMFPENNKTVLCTKQGWQKIAELKFEEHEEADTRIFALVSFYRKEMSRFVLYSVDTDVLVLSLYYSVYLDTKIWLHRGNFFIPCHTLVRRSSEVFEIAPAKFVNNLLAAYCLSGCDSVSFPFRKGKRKAFKLIVSKKNPLKDLEKFGEVNKNNEYGVEDVADACRAFFKALYSRPEFTGSMDHLRAHLFPSCKTDIRYVMISFFCDHC